MFISTPLATNRKNIPSHHPHFLNRPFGLSLEENTSLQATGINFHDINERCSNISSCTNKHECPKSAARHPLLNRDNANYKQHPNPKTKYPTTHQQEEDQTKNIQDKNQLAYPSLYSHNYHLPYKTTIIKHYFTKRINQGFDPLYFRPQSSQRYNNNLSFNINPNDTLNI